MVPLLQLYSNPSMSRVSPQKLVFRSEQSPRSEGVTRSSPRLARQLRQLEVGRALARYVDVRNMRQVAREFGISRTTAAKLLSAQGIDTSRRLTTTDIGIAVGLYDQGHSSAVIGDRLGFDNHTILDELRKAGVAIRPPSPGPRR